MVDSAEADKLDEAKVELWRTMKYQDNKDIPLLILANKQDLQEALSAPDIEDALGEENDKQHLQGFVFLSHNDRAGGHK